jgi:hypothetical protein
MRNTNDILREALHATAEASERLVPGTGKHYLAFANELYPPMKAETISCNNCINGVAQRLEGDRLIEFDCEFCEGGEIEICSHCKEPVLRCEGESGCNRDLRGL